MEYKKIIKRVIDLILSLVSILILLPFLILISILIKLNIGSPIVFTQTRVGKDNKSFKIYKFRTMNNNTDKNGQLLPDKDRITGIGRFLRNSSIDELPELINIVKGEMSFIGPRPLLEEYLKIYNERQLKRHTVLPGLSGWAQVNGRNLISWKEKFELDLWYVENWTLALDIKIFLLTFIKVFKREGVNKTELVTSDKFNGIN